MIHMHILIYLSSRIVLCMLINMMVSSVLHGKSKSKFSFSVFIMIQSCFPFYLEYSSIYILFRMTFSLDRVSPYAIKYVFVEYFRTQKWYKYYDLMSRIYFVSTNIIFFLVYPTFHFFNIYKPIFFLSSMIACVFYGCWEGVSV